MEKILTAVPYPMTGHPDTTAAWGIVCEDHPLHMGGNVPTDVERCCAEAFAEAVACGHPEHFGVSLVHVVSATAIVVDGMDHQLAMCGKDMGPYRKIPACHPVGNYLSSESPWWAVITCAGCLTRCGKVCA